MKKTFAIAIASAALLLAAANQTFTGTITDSMCGADHKSMHMGSDAKCVTECVRMGAHYTLWDGKTNYGLSDQRNAAKFPAKKVTVTGSLNAKGDTIQVTSIKPAP